MLINLDETRIYYKTLDTLPVDNTEKMPMLFRQPILGYGDIIFLHPINLPILQTIGLLYRAELINVEENLEKEPEEKETKQ